MARIILDSYMVRYPLGGMMSWVLQYLVGFQRLGHEIYFVEKSGYPNSCFDVSRNLMTDDCSYGTAAVADLLGRFGLDHRWRYVDASGTYHGLPRPKIEEVFKTADLFIDMGSEANWLSEAEHSQLRVRLDGEPGFNQMRMQKLLAAGEQLPRHDVYYTNGRNVGRSNCSAPTAGRQWRPIFNPVVADLFPSATPPPGAPFSTVMHWQSHDPLEFNGTTYGQKDVEFVKFQRLPSLTPYPLEIAVGGRKVPRDALRAYGWQVRDAHAVTISFDSFQRYIVASAGEFAVCKNVFVATNTGWFSDRSAAYLAAGRPVVIQDTGFSDHLPIGQGLFAVRTVEEAASAVAEVVSDYGRHSHWAVEVAHEHLDASKVLGHFLAELGL